MFDTYDPNATYTKRLDPVTYKFIGVQRGDNAFIPVNTDNKDYAEFLRWYDAQDPKPFTLEDEEEPAEVALQRQKNAIKAKAHADILAIAPEWKQRNMIARSVELMDKKVAGILTTEEQAQLDGIQAVWDQVKTIREQSDADEQALEA